MSGLKRPGDVPGVGAGLRGGRPLPEPPEPAPGAPATVQAPVSPAGDRPAAADLLAPVKATIQREALKVDLPVALALVKRMHQYRLDKGIDLRDQAALALDLWLTSEGY